MTEGRARQKVEGHLDDVSGRPPALSAYGRPASRVCELYLGLY